MTGLEQRDPFVYFIQQGDDGPVKIGWAWDPPGRLGELQVGNPVDLHIRRLIRGDVRIESVVHWLCRVDRIRGEWFRASPAVVALMERVDLEEHVWEQAKPSQGPNRCDACGTDIRNEYLDEWDEPEPGHTTCRACLEARELGEAA